MLFLDRADSNSPVVKANIDLEAGTFRGEETIELKVARATDRVVLHSVALTIVPVSRAIRSR